MKRGMMPLIDWYARLRNVVIKNKEPASRTYRYMSRLIEQEFNRGEAGACLAFFSPDNDKLTADALLMLGYCLQSELDSRVLIVDARLRDTGSGITDRLGLAGAPGYADVLRDGFQDRFDMIRKTAVANVDVLPAGRQGQRDPAIIDRERLREFLDAVAGQYRHVLLQVGPVMGDTRNLLTVSQTDAVFLIAEENRTLMKSVDDSRKLLLSNGIQDFRVVISGSEQ